ncbi:Hint domain-containing protein [Bradyrhizobium sp. WSM471]|uniref:Hint domain-containing protein n=1 Tax=Bradyrhizobium sp. WSM471 TaxID=319017 RepID=UPI001E48CBDD|nr:MULTISPECIES: Hint domain-containing protein [Bradyrhizobium]UFW43445.1 Hint domain-containing protein [Bradyrhizobium canariense]
MDFEVITMVTKTSEEFNFAYELVKTGGTYKLVDADSSSPGVNPVAVGVKAVDRSGNDPLDHGDKVKISDVASGSLSNGNKYTFIATADLAGHNGIIIQDNHGNYFFLTDTAYSGNLNGQHGRLTNVDTNAEVTFCFYSGTLIRTPQGDVAVEALKRGDLVLTHDGRTVPVDWVGIQTVSTVFADKMRSLPIRVRAGALADNVPSRDLLVSPDHALLVDGTLIQAGALVNGASIARETAVPSTFVYYHVEVEDHSLIIAENTPAETFIDNVDRLGFDNWAEHVALYPNGKPVSELPYPRAKSHRQVPVSIRIALAARAQTDMPQDAQSVA